MLDNNHSYFALVSFIEYLSGVGHETLKDLDRGRRSEKGDKEKGLCIAYYIACIELAISML